MIKNDIYTYDYFQPKDYRFSLDSVFLAQKVARIIHQEIDLESWTVLDLCAGCGIVGLELSLHESRLRHFDFLEVQAVYRDYFKKNVDMIYPDPGLKCFQFLEMNYKHLLSEEFKAKYNLIVSNPPYFFPGEGLLSPNEFKNRCRFFLDADFETLMKSIDHALKPEGMAYILVRKGDHHGRDPIVSMQGLFKHRKAQIIDDVRGTHIVEIGKKF